nr:Ty3/gypsy retrotransposon protein [Tanacetum cinerariifolium]
MDNVYKLHGMPNTIVSDRDKIFISQFWQALFTVIKVSLAEYWYNTNYHSSGHTTLFEIVYGQPPNLHLPYIAGTSSLEEVDMTMQAMEQAIAMLQFHLKRSKNRIKSMADKHRSDKNFKVGMKVYLKLQPYRQSTVRQGTHHKFTAKYYGPFVVIAKVGKVGVLPLYRPDGVLSVEPEAIIGRRLGKLNNKAVLDNKERVMQFKIFKDNVAYIEDFNSQHYAYKLSINKFTDQTKEEFIATHTRFKVPLTLRLAQNMTFRYDSVTGIPSSMDWRQKGAVTLVKAQVQELMDYDKNSEDKGCEGGFPVNGFDYIKNKGINTEASYPYQGHGSNRTCNTTKEAVHEATNSGNQIVPANNESALLKAVAVGI